MTGFNILFYNLLWESLDWLFPPECVGCHRTGSSLCKNCQENIQPINIPICDVCGIPLSDYLPSNHYLCAECEHRHRSFHSLRSYSTFEGIVKDALYGLKYKKNLALGMILSRLLSCLLSKLSWNYDCIIPVPLSKLRLAERGYNQSALIAHPLALLNHTEYLPNALVRVKEASSQVGLSTIERQKNVMGAFRLTSNQIINKTILLVDDVATTCATLDSCAITLREGGARDVYCVTFARTILLKN